MKHRIQPPNLTEEYLSADQEGRRQQVFLAVEAELDVNRPFSIEWGPNDLYFSIRERLYFYRHTGLNLLETEIINSKPIEILDITPHLAEFEFK